MTAEPPTETRKPYARRVYGRRRVQLDGAEWHVELHSYNLVIRQLYARKARAKTIPLQDVIDQLGLGQKLLPL